MAGTLPIALTQQSDINGAPLAGALLYIFQVSTVATPQNSFQDFGLSIANPWPLTSDQFGRIPMFYLADGQVHVRLTDASGVVIFDYPSIQVIGPSSGGGGGGGGSVDPTTILSTGDVKWRATSETLTGWVKANAQTIGNATSGASQRANSDTQNLFTYLWQNFNNYHCPVGGGRGSTAASDFSAGKTMGLPDLRGRSPFGLDNMGATAAGRLQASNVTSGNGDGTTSAAATGGEANHTLVNAEIPHGLITLTQTPHAHQWSASSPTGAGGYGTPIWTPENTNSGSLVNSTTAVNANISLNDYGGSGAHNNMSPFILGTFYVKL